MLAGLLILALAACAETELVLHAVKHLGNETPTPAYKIGDPYQIDDVWYRPAVDYTYVETGIASWYGADFHNRATANGETYNMDLVTAAHRTLPLPSMVQVTNLENGRSLKVRVNDRGPFARGRIIDMSKRGAELLGFKQQGTAKVRVEILAEGKPSTWPVSRRVRHCRLHRSRSSLLPRQRRPIHCRQQPYPRRTRRYDRTRGTNTDVHSSRRLCAL